MSASAHSIIGPEEQIVLKGQDELGVKTFSVV